MFVFTAPSINSAVSWDDGKGTCPLPTAGKPKLGPARSHKSPARCRWLKGQKRQEEMCLCYLLVAGDGPGVQSLGNIVAFGLLPVTTEPAKHPGLQHLPAGGLKVKECQDKGGKACLATSDMMIIAIASNHT